MTSRPVLDPLDMLKDEPAEDPVVDIERFAPRRRHTDQGKAAAALVVGQSAGLRPSHAPEAPPPAVERPLANALAPEAEPPSPEPPAAPARAVVSIRERKAAKAPPEQMVGISARVRLSLYERLDRLRDANRCTLPELLEVAVAELEAMEESGQLADRLRRR